MAPLRQSVLGVFLVAFVAWLCWPHNRGQLSVLVILDTVRADHTSVCGYARPTTPVLEGLVAGGASLSCDVWAPGSWTLPSHASYFTGLPVPEHHAHPVDREGKKEEGVRSLGPARALHGDFDTLAEQRPSILVSGNPVLGSTSGLDQGFRYSYVPLRFGHAYDEDFIEVLGSGLLEARDGDLLVLNIADAHQPWRDIPDGLDWVPPTETLRYRPERKRGLWRQWHAGSPDETRRQRIVDLYDYAVFCADRTLGRALDAIAIQGFAIQDLTITSDHGEHLGEHGLLGHGHYLTDENQRVPLISTHALPEGPISATVVYDLALGRAPADRPVRAVAYPHRTKREWFQRSGLYGHTSARSWEPDQHWISPASPPEGDFGDFVEQALESGIATSDESELGNRLEALGYF